MSVCFHCLSVVLTLGIAFNVRLFLVGFVTFAGLNLPLRPHKPTQGANADHRFFIQVSNQPIHPHRPELNICMEEKTKSYIKNITN